MSVPFCSKCENMYYNRLAGEGSNKLIYYCRNCGHEDEKFGSENIIVSKTEIKRENQNYEHVINEYTHLDPTLPRTNNIPCPNAKCSTHGDDPDNPVTQEVIFIRYDDDRLKYVYLCVHCKTQWRTGNITNN